jgi:hypothetical protein
MREVRVESLDGLEKAGDELRLSANGGALSIVFPRKVWEDILHHAPGDEAPAEDELKELESIRRRLEALAEGDGFEEVLRAVPCRNGDPGAGRERVEYDLVLRPAGLFAVTTGYHFAPVVGEELAAAIGSGLRRDTRVEQAYAIGAVASEGALRLGDENLKVLAVRGRRCSTSRFEMTPELWRVLSEGLGWRNVETYTAGRSS